MPLKPLTRHLDSVGETYFQHMRVASGCGARMVAGGVACLVHALFPFLFTNAATDQIRYLHRRMIESRAIGQDRPCLPERQA